MVVQESNMVVYFSSYPKYILRGFLQEWFSPIDLLKFLAFLSSMPVAYPVPQHLITNIWSAFFLKNQADLNWQHQCKLLDCYTNNASFKLALYETDLRNIFLQQLANTKVDGAYRFRLLRALSQGKVTTQRAELCIYPREATPLAHLLCGVTPKFAPTGNFADLKAEPVNQSQLSFEYVLGVLNDERCDRRMHYEDNLAQLIPYLAIEDVNRLIDTLFSMLKNQESSIRLSALKLVAVSILTDSIKDVRPFIEPILAQYTDSNIELLIAAVNTTAALITRLEAVEAQVFLPYFLEWCRDQSKYYDYFHEHVLNALTVLLNRVKITDALQLKPVLQELALCEDQPRKFVAALGAMSALIPQLEITDAHELTVYLIARYSDDVGDVSKTALKAIKVLLPKFEATEIPPFIHLLASKYRPDAPYTIGQSMRQAFSILTQKMSNEHLADMICVLILHLNHSKPDSRKAAFDLLSWMMVSQPGHDYSLNGPLESLEQLAIIKMREMLTMIQASEEEQNKQISHSNLKFLLDRYQSKTWASPKFNVLRRSLCFFTWHQRRTIVQLQHLLSLKKTVYSKDEIVAAMRNDRHAQHHLRLFLNKDEPKRLNSATDDVLCALRQKF